MAAIKSWRGSIRTVPSHKTAISIHRRSDFVDTFLDLVVCSTSQSEIVKPWTYI